MIYWHVAVIVIALGGDESITVNLPFRDEMACGNALPLLVEAVRADHPDSYAMCIPSGLPSGVSVRPEARP